MDGFSMVLIGYLLGRYRFYVYFDRKEMDEKRKLKNENAEARNQLENELIAPLWDSLKKP